MRAKSLYVELYDYLEGFEQTEKIDIFEQIVKEWSEEQVEDFIMELLDAFLVILFRRGHIIIFTQILP